jgi:hypothetical protein
MIEQLRRLDRAILSLAHAMWFRKLMIICVACVAMSIAASVVSVSNGGISEKTECLAFPVARGAADALRHVSVEFSNGQTWRQAMNYHYVLSILVILGIVLHATLAGIHLNEKLRGHFKKHPVWLKSVVTAGAMLIAVGAVPELGAVGAVPELGSLVGGGAMT